jgi:hypothetical protein
MNLSRTVRRLAQILAGLATVVVTSLAAVFASTPSWRARLLSWADPPLPSVWDKHPPLPADVHAAVTGGIPGWQTTLIAIRAGLLAATMTVLEGQA